MSMVDAIVPPPPIERGIEIASIEIIFDEIAVRKGNGTPLDVVKEDSEVFAKALAAALTRSLEVQVFVLEVGVSSGSVKLRAKIIAFIVPIVQGAAGGAIGNLATQPSTPVEPQKYEQVCEKVRTTTQTYTEEYFMKKGYQPKTTVVTTTTTFEEVCRQIKSPKTTR